MGQVMIDVERLARAMRTVEDDPGADWLTSDAAVRAIAAEYARLTSPEPTPEEKP